MSNLDGQPENLPESLPEVVVRKQRWPSPVWLIPLVAILIGFWLLFQTWYEKGPTVIVQFASAEGIEAGQTEVRYKAVTVGKLKKITLSDDLNNIDATIQLNKEIGRHLGSDASFWVVSPRVSRSGVSGLSTFFSGTYIGMDPGTDNDDQGFYIGEDKPPPIAPSENGRRFSLTSNTLGSMDVGSPVFYRKLQVGEVIDYKLDAQNEKVRLEIFIRDPYYDFVRTNTRFWNASGIEFSMDSEGAEFQMESLVSLLVGGVAFETPQTRPGEISPEGGEFLLYDSYDSSQAKQYDLILYYVMHFNGSSVRGLAPGSPVEFQGIPIGKVENVDVTLDPETLDVRIPVLVSIQPQHFNESLNHEDAQQAISKLVQKGLRAKLETGSLLTGSKLVTLSMEKNPQPAEIVAGQFFSEFPTTGSAFEDLPLMATEIMASLDETLTGVKKLVNSGKLDETVDNANNVLVEAEQAIRAATATLKTVDARTLPSVTRDINQITVELGETLQTIQGSMLKVDQLTAQNSPTQYQLQEMLEEVTAASRAVRSLTETLQRQPASLLRGKQ